MSTVHHRRRFSRTTVTVARFVALAGFWFSCVAAVHGAVWLAGKLEGKIPGVHAPVLRK